MSDWMIVLDTSILISLLNEKDIHHNAAVELFKELEKKDEGLAISNYIINEAVTVMLRRRGLEMAKLLNDFLLNYKKLEVFHIDEKGFSEILDIFNKQSDHLSFTDCTIVWMAKKQGFTVKSFDDNLLIEIENLKKISRKDKRD